MVVSAAADPPSNAAVYARHNFVLRAAVIASLAATGATAASAQFAPDRFCLQLRGSVGIQGSVGDCGKGGH